MGQMPVPTEQTATVEIEVTVGASSVDVSVPVGASNRQIVEAVNETEELDVNYGDVVRIDLTDSDHQQTKGVTEYTRYATVVLEGRQNG